MIKLNAKQLEVLTMMNDGWEAIRIMARNGATEQAEQYYLQYSSKIKKIHWATFCSLLDRDLIEGDIPNCHFPKFIYVLTEEAKGILETIERKAKS